MDGDNKISKAEFKLVVRSMHQVLGKLPQNDETLRVSNEQKIDYYVDKVFNNFDQDRDGNLSLIDFKKGCMLYPQLGSSSSVTLSSRARFVWSWKKHVGVNQGSYSTKYTSHFWQRSSMELSIITDAWYFREHGGNHSHFILLARSGSTS